MDSLPLPIAKEEYTRQIENAVIPQIFKGFLDMFKEALEETTNEGKQYLVLKRFQKFLKGIKKWNDTILKEATDETLKEVPSFKKLVVTILLGNVTILTAIKLKGSNSNIKVKIPPMSVIVHRIYIESARTFYYKPELFLKPEEFSNRKEIHDIVKEAVSEALSQCIPIDDILEETIGENYNNPELSGDLLNHTESESPEEESESPEVESEEEESEEEEPEEEEESEPEEEESEPEEEVESEEENSGDETESLEAKDSDEEKLPEESSETPTINVLKPKIPTTPIHDSSKFENLTPTVTQPAIPKSKLPFTFHPHQQTKFNISKLNSRPLPKLKLKTHSN